jgi:hypothetical protein
VHTAHFSVGSGTKIDKKALRADLATRVAEDPRT